jgi:hypothetical protein
MRLCLLILSAVLLIFGCTTVVQLPPVTPDHPASPYAKESPAPVHPGTLFIGEEGYLKSPAPPPLPEKKNHDHGH